MFYDRFIKCKQCNMLKEKIETSKYRICERENICFNCLDLCDIC